MKKLLPFLFFLFSFAVLSQEEKREFEKRIDKSEMPNNALILYNSETPENIRKERFYFEKDGSKKSYEAKYKYAKHRYSIEFSENGNLQDIEIKIKEKEVSEKSFREIKNYLEKKHERYKIEKIQAQFVHRKNARTVFQKALNFKAQSRPDNYEFIVLVKNNGERQRYELLFDHNGNFLQKRKIVHESYHFLLF